MFNSIIKRSIIMLMVGVLLGLPLFAAEEVGGSETSDKVKPQEISIIAQNFKYLPASIMVKQGVPVKLYLTSADRRHDLKIDELKIKEKVEKGKITIIEFTPTKAGRYPFRCAFNCGSGHSQMKGELIVVGDEMKEDKNDVN